MRYQHALITLAAIGQTIAGTPDAPVITTPAGEPLLTPTLDIRARYEFGEVDGLDPSHAFTFRERLGLKTQSWNGLSAFVEGEFSQAAIDDYNGGAPLADPAVVGNSVIGDPETNELNQGYLQYSAGDTVTKFGRQRIIYDNAAFIGNVGWRQNEQTFDAISVASTYFSDLTLNYAYINQVNRIFGSDAGGILENLPGDLNLVNLSYAGIDGLTLGAYAYLMNFEDSPALENETYGVSAKGNAFGLTLYGELAWQEKAGVTAEEEALYAHATATKAFGKQSLTLGVEHLDAGLKTPLSTVHAFNGYADAFIGGRFAGTHNGLTDVYLAHTLPVCWGMNWTNSVHALGDNEVSTGYGWEVDSVLAKKFSESVLGIAKVAHFESEGDGFVGANGLPTTTRVSLEMNYKF